MTSGSQHLGPDQGLRSVRRPRPAPRTRGRPANMPRRPSRTTGWSSTIRRRIGQGSASCGWAEAGTRAEMACLRRARTRSPACRPPGKALAHRRSARTRAARRRRRAREPHAIVAHVERDHIAHIGQCQARPGSPRRAWRRSPAPPAAIRSSARSISGGGARRGSDDLDRHAVSADHCRRRLPAPRAGGSVQRRPARRLHRRRASDRLSRARRPAWSRCRAAPPHACACSAACNWVMMPVRPCASVSWISRAMRCRSSGPRPHGPAPGIGRAAPRSPSARTRVGPPLAGAARSPQPAFH